MRIENWMLDLPSQFLSKIFNNNFQTIYRYGHGFEKLGDGTYRRHEPGAWVWGVDKSINISDLFFYPSPPDPFSGYSFAHKTFVHEMAHAYDAAAIYEEFLDLIGWYKKDGEWLLRDNNAREARALYKEVEAMGLKALHTQDPQLLTEAMKLNRSYGMHRGFPTAFSMKNPSECFAEIVSHLFVDPISRTYLPNKVVKWFEANVDGISREL